MSYRDQLFEESFTEAGQIRAAQRESALRSARRAFDAVENQVFQESGRRAWDTAVAKIGIKEGVTNTEEYQKMRDDWGEDAGCSEYAGNPNILEPFHCISSDSKPPCLACYKLTQMVKSPKQFVRILQEMVNEVTPEEDARIEEAREVLEVAEEEYDENH